MKISATIRNMINNDKPLKAVASVTLDDAFAIHNVKVIETPNGLFAAMPCDIYKDKNGNEIRRDVFHPVNAEARKVLQEAVLKAYADKLNEQAIA